MRISDWSSDVCSSDLDQSAIGELVHVEAGQRIQAVLALIGVEGIGADDFFTTVDAMLDEPELGPVNLPPGRSLFAVDRKSVLSGKSVSVRVDLGGRRIITTTNCTSLTILSNHI